MKKLAFVLSAAMVLCQTLFAALPPLYQSTQELDTIFKNPEFIKKMPEARPIKSIIAIENGYIIETEACTIQIDVIHNNDQSIGPLRFDLKVNDPVCKDNGKS